MITVLLVLQAFVTLALIGVVLIQRSEGGGLGLGSSQGMGNFMTGRGTASFLTRTTAVLATAFMALSLILALLYKNGGTSSGESILNGPVPATSAPASSSPASTKAPATPLAPLPPIPGESAGTTAATPPAHSAGTTPAPDSATSTTTKTPVPTKTPTKTPATSAPAKN
jgi:protein translocase subunit secG